MDPAIEESITRSILGKTKLSGDEIDLMKRMFRYYDTDNDGHLTREQASTLFGELGYSGEHWAQKRIPMEDFLLKCGSNKKNTLETTEDSVEATSIHAFAILDQPRTGFVNFYKLKTFLAEIEEGISDDRVQRIAEIISSSDEAEFTEADMYEYMKANLKLSIDMENAREAAAEEEAAAAAASAKAE
jgi:Ca2+-binding EF-hand superfamily protein